MNAKLTFTKRQALALAAALTLAVGTAAAAVAGLANTPARQAAPPANAAIVSQAVALPPAEVDD